MCLLNPPQSLKYEEVYVRAYDSICAAHPGVAVCDVLQPVQTHRARDAYGPEQVCCDTRTALFTVAWSEHSRDPLKEWNILPKQVGPSLTA